MTTPRIVRPGEAPSYWFMGIRATLLSCGDLGAPTTIELILPPGGVTPLHLHEDDDDSGMIVDGAIKSWCDGEFVDAAAGSWLSLPRGRPHAQLVVSDGPARVIAVYSNRHFADFIAEVGTPADQPPPGPPSPADFPRLREIAARHRLQLMGPAPAELLAYRR
jgi:uncharacterized RmlC-like cupin family protein